MGEAAISVVFRAEDEPVSSRLEYWRHLGAEAVAPVEVRLDGGHDFRSRIRTGSIGPVQVTEMTGPPAQAARTAKLIRRSDPELCKIDVVTRGTLRVEQDGRQASLGPGDFTLVDLSRPAWWAHSATRVVAVLFPRTLMPLAPDELGGLTGIRVDGGRGAGALVSTLACQLPGQLDAIDAHGAAGCSRLGTAMIDLLGAALTGRGQLPPDSSQEALRARIRAFIEQRLADRALAPGMIAASHHISVRYLYKLFEAETRGRGVAGWIRQRRLERCQRDLLDPALASRPVNAIAARWGFADAASFSRTFRAAYGVSPARYRGLRGFLTAAD